MNFGFHCVAPISRLAFSDWKLFMIFHEIDTFQQIFELIAFLNVILNDTYCSEKLIFDTK